MKSIYKRVVVKLSGEALADSTDKTIFDRAKLKQLGDSIVAISKQGVQVGVVVGAGNIWRGKLADTIGIERSTADYMGMLGTIINALALQSVIEENGVSSRVMSSINVPQVCEPYIRRKAISYLEKGIIVIFAGGTGNPYFTTDSTATLRAMEVGAQAILMAKNDVNGVYDSDPHKNPSAKFIDHLSFREIVEKKLGIMDLTAVAMLDDTDIVIHVFNMSDPANFQKVLAGEKVGTTISKE